MRRAAIVLLVLTSASGCVHHPGLPATSTSDYEAKAASTATAAISAVATVGLALDAEDAGHATGAYLGGTVGDQEDRLEEVVSSFSAVSPPTETARTLRSDLLDVLGDATDHVAGVRIELDAGDRTAALALRSDLADDGERLAEFES